MKELMTEIELEATPEEVWGVMNGFRRRIDGEPGTRVKLEVRMEPEGERAIATRAMNEALARRVAELRPKAN